MKVFKKALLCILVSFFIIFGAWFAGNAEAYDRSQWLPRWSDFDGDCQSTRHELLIQFSLTPVTFESDRKCKVKYGLWLDPYSGEYFFGATQVDIEHIVPLKWAEERGANTWSTAQKRRFAEDPDNLWVVSAKLNREKGAKGPMEWMPPYRPTKAIYAAKYKSLADRYGLVLTRTERLFLERAINGQVTTPL